MQKLKEEKETTLELQPVCHCTFGTMAELSFNVDHGYLEGLVRGMKAGILTRSDYHHLAQCDTLEGKIIWFLHKKVSYKCWNI